MTQAMDKFFELMNDKNSAVIPKFIVRDYFDEVLKRQLKSNNNTISSLKKAIHENAVNKGFYDCPECEGTGEITVKDEDRDTCPKCHLTGKAEKNIGELLMLVVSELGEALEADRKNKHAYFNGLTYSEISGQFKSFFEQNIKDTFEDELADAIIRILDMCGYLEIDIEKHIILKMNYNSMREYKHGKRY